jgi:tetratricopeptide (TPR) repeat protein
MAGKPTTRVLWVGVAVLAAVAAVGTATGVVSDVPRWVAAPMVAIGAAAAVLASPIFDWWLSQIESRRMLEDALESAPIRATDADPWSQMRVNDSPLQDRSPSGYVPREVDQIINAALRQDRALVIVIGDHGSGRTRTMAEALRTGRQERWLIIPRRPSSGSREHNLLRDAVAIATRDGDPGRSWFLVLDDVEDYVEVGALRASLIKDWATHGVKIIASADRRRWLQLAHTAGRKDLVGASGVAALVTQTAELASPPTSQEAVRARAKYPDNDFRHGIGQAFVGGPWLVDMLLSDGTSPPDKAELVALLAACQATGLARALLKSEVEMLWGATRDLAETSAQFDETWAWACRPVTSGYSLVIEQQLGRFVCHPYVVAYLADSRNGGLLDGFPWSAAGDLAGPSELTAMADAAEARGLNDVAAALLGRAMVSLGGEQRGIIMLRRVGLLERLGDKAAVVTEARLLRIEAGEMAGPIAAHLVAKALLAEAQALDDDGDAARLLRVLIGRLRTQPDPDDPELGFDARLALARRLDNLTTGEASKVRRRLLERVCQDYSPRRRQVATEALFDACQHDEVTACRRYLELVLALGLDEAPDLVLCRLADAMSTLAERTAMAEPSSAVALWARIGAILSEHLESPSTAERYASSLMFLALEADSLSECRLKRLREVEDLRGVLAKSRVGKAFLCESLFQLGQELGQRVDADGALAAWDLAIEYWPQGTEDFLTARMAYLRRSIGTLRYRPGAYDSALASWKLALELWEATSSKWVINDAALAAISIANHWRAYGDNNRAAKYLRWVRDQFVRGTHLSMAPGMRSPTHVRSGQIALWYPDSRTPLADAAMALGEVEEARGDLKAASDAYSSVLETYIVLREHVSPRPLLTLTAARAGARLVNILRRRGRFEAASETAQQLAQYIGASGGRPDDLDAVDSVGSALIEGAEACKSADASHKAIDCYGLALRIAAERRGGEFPSWAAGAADGLAAVYADAGDPLSAASVLRWLQAELDNMPSPESIATRKTASICEIRYLLDHLSDPAAATLASASMDTVASWRAGRKLPRPDQIETMRSAARPVTEWCPPLWGKAAVRPNRAGSPLPGVGGGGLRVCGPAKVLVSRPRTALALGPVRYDHVVDDRDARSNRMEA